MPCIPPLPSCVYYHFNILSCSLYHHPENILKYLLLISSSALKESIYSWHKFNATPFILKTCPSETSYTTWQWYCNDESYITISVMLKSFIFKHTMTLSWCRGIEDIVQTVLLFFFYNFLALLWFPFPFPEGRFSSSFYSSILNMCITCESVTILHRF